MATQKSQESSTNKAKISAVLSRGSVYAPLESYDYPSPDVPLSSSVAKKLQSNQLLQFYTNVSTHFHRTNARLDCKNTAGRPLSATDINGRIHQRALTLVGGGYNNASTSNKTANKKGPLTTTTSRSQRKHKRQRLLQRIGYSSPIPALLEEHDNQFLHELNSLWNAYVSKVLQIPSFPDSSIVAQISVRARQLADSIEWVGSRVRVHDCASGKTREGITGILVSQTSNTWRIAPIVVGTRTAALSAVETGAKVKSMECTWQLKKTLIVRKEGSSLAFLIPLFDGKSIPSSNVPQYLSIVLHAKESKKSSKENT